MSELYEYVQGVYLARAIVAVVASPRKPTFSVTAKGVSLDKAHLSSLAGPFVAIFALLALGTATAAYRYLFEPGVTELMLVVGLWSLFNLVIAGVALGAVAERPTAERIPGLPVARRGTLTIGGREVPVAITRASAGGLTARPEGGVDLGELGAAHGHLAVVPVVAGTALPALPVLVGAAGTARP